MNKFTKSALMLSAAVLIGSTTALAQSTTSEIRGTVTTDAGAPISNAHISIINTATGFSRIIDTDGNGQFTARNLNVSGQYDISISGDGYQSERVEGIALSIGQTTKLNFDLSAFDAARDEIIVVGQRTVLADVAIGPSAVFNLSDLQNLPSANRDIKDIIKLDPRIYIDESFNDAIQCAGANPRFNSLTVDGVRMNDNFGLNSNGFPTERIPFSFDAIEQVAVELAPVDVEYGGFTACNINAVTKSGKNEMYGSVFFDYTTESLKGDTTDGIDISNDGFEEYRYGINVGLPIIKDKLFLFAAYEKLNGSNLFGNTLATSNVSRAEYDEIIDIATSQYGYISGGLPATADNKDEKILIKLDWNINDSHRAAFTFNYNDGFNISQSDAGTTRLADGNHFFERGAELTSYAGVIYSDWTDNLSTEIGGSFLDLNNRQLPLADFDYGEVQIRNQGAFGRTTVYLGPDDSRHANKLNYELFSIKAKADYRYNNHLLTVGFENEQFKVFNLFVQEARGETVFDSIDDFRAGRFSDYKYESAAGTNNVDDAAAKFSFAIRSLYAQDVWEVTDNLTFTYGLRYDVHASSDVPTFNQNFLDDHGIRNDVNLDGKSLIQPRFGFNLDLDNGVEVHGGVGLFSGGNPNVWLSNNYSNNGVTQFEYRCRSASRGRDRCNGILADINNPNVSDFTFSNGGAPLQNIPDEGLDAVANANGRGPVNAVDADFKLPSEWKYSLGTSFELDAGALGSGYRVALDFLYSKTNEAPIIRNLELTQNGVAPDGRPLYSGAPFNDFLLTNADEKGSSLVLSGYISQKYDFGLDWSVGYAYTDSKDVAQMTSSVAFSNDKATATSDVLNLGLGTSNFEIPHRFTWSATYRRDFFKDLTTTFSMFGSYSKGSPFSYTFTNCDDTRSGQRCAGLAVAQFEGFFDDARRQLLYVPTGPNDPLVTYAAGFDQSAFFNFLEESGLNEFAGQIAPRNGFHDNWFTKIDLKIKQEFPGFREGDRASAFIVLDNALNFIDSDWGVLRRHSSTTSVVDVNFPNRNDTSQFVYSNFNSNAINGAVRTDPSTWEVRFGFNYDF
jgi:hypothetical protein